MQNACWHSGNALGCLNMKQRPPQQQAGRQGGSGVGSRRGSGKREANGTPRCQECCAVHSLTNFTLIPPFAYVTVQQPK